MRVSTWRTVSPRPAADAKNESDEARDRPSRNSVYRVGDFEVHPSLNTIRGADHRIRCEPRVIDLLMCLIRHAPSPVSKEDLMTEVWPKTTVSDDAIWRCISELRRAFDDSAGSPGYIETIPRRGYRLIAGVERLKPANTSQAPRPTTRRRWLALVAALAILSIASVLLFRSIEPSRASDRRDFSSFEAFSAFTKGQQLNRRGTPDVVGRAVEHLQAAVDLDPRSALGQSELTRALVRAARLQVLPSDAAFTRARRAAVRAVELDPALGAAHAAFGAVLFWHDRHWSAAETELKTALDLDPNHVQARRDYAQLLAALGRHEDATAEIERAWRLDQLSPLTSLDAGWIYYYSGRLEDALEECRFTRDLIPESHDVRSCLLAAYLLDERFDDAAEIVRELARSRGTELTVTEETGPRETLESATKELFAASDSAAALGPNDVLDAARLHVALGQHDGALLWIERAAAEGDAALAHLDVDPCFRPLRSDTGFQQLLRRLGFS